MSCKVPPSDHCISLRRYCFGLETRVILKISTHHCYPRNFDWKKYFKIDDSCFCPMKICQSFLGRRDGSKFGWLSWFPTMNNTCVNLCNKTTSIKYSAYAIINCSWPAVVTWHSYMGCFRPLLVGIGLTIVELS